MVALIDQCGEAGEYGGHTGGSSKTGFSTFEGTGLGDQLINAGVVVAGVDDALPLTGEGGGHIFGTVEGKATSQVQRRGVLAVVRLVHLPTDSAGLGLEVFIHNVKVKTRAFRLGFLWAVSTLAKGLCWSEGIHSLHLRPRKKTGRLPFFQVETAGSNHSMLT